MEVFISPILTVVFLMFLNSKFHFKRKIRSYFDSNLGYRAFNTFVCLLLMTPLIVMLGHYFFNSELFLRFLFGLSYVNYCTEEK